MTISIRDALKNSGQLDNWLGDPGQGYSRNVEAPAPKQNFMSNVGHGAAAIGGAVASVVAGGIKGATNLVSGTQRNISLNSQYKQVNLEGQRKALEARDMQSHQAYKSGKLSKQQFQAEQHNLLKEFEKLSGATHDVAQNLSSQYYGTEAVAKDYTSAAGLVLTAASPFTAAGVGTGLIGRTAASVPGAARLAKGLDAGFGAGKTLFNASGIKGAPVITAGKLGRNAFIQPTIESATAIPGELKRGEYGNAAANAALLLAPVGIAGVAKYAPKLGSKVATAMYGREGFWNTVNRVSGIDMLKYHDGLTGAAKTDFEATLRRVAQKKIDELGGDSKKAGVAFVEYLESNGRDISKLTPDQWAKELKTWVKADDAASAYGEAGLAVFGANTTHVLKEGERIGAARFNQQDQTKLRQAFSEANTAEERRMVLSNMERAGADFTKNPTLMAKLKQVADSDNWAKEFEDVPALVSVFMGGAKKLPGGYIPAVMKRGEAFKPLKEVAALDKGEAPKAGFELVGKGLRKAGVSTESLDPNQFRKFNAALTNELKQIDLPHIPASIKDKLRGAAEGAAGVTDERQLSVSAIKNAIEGITEAQARAIKGAYHKAYKSLSLEELGFAGKVEANLYRMPGYGTYRRIQGAARYQFNPAFRAQELAETEILSQLTARGQKSMVYPGSKMIDRMFNKGAKTDDLDKTINILKDHKILAGQGMGSVGAGENQVTQIAAKLTDPQRRSIAGLVDVLASKANMSVEDFIRTADPKVLDSIRTVVQYPRTGFTSSNAAKTLNLLIFPSRYTIKLASILGRELANSPALMQIATVKGAADLASYLNSDEGIRWQSENSEVLGLIAYFNPLMNLKGFFKAVGGQTPELGDFGMIGGLPLGAVSQMLQTMGVVPKPNSAYLNPKTGEVVPDRIPTSLGGGVKMAMQDLIGSMYSFPGRQLGTDLSKRQLTEGFLSFLKPDNNEATYEKTDELTAHQQRIQEVLGAKQPSTSKSAPSTPSLSRPLSIPKQTLAPVYTAKNPRAPKAPRAKIYARKPGPR